ncbi:MAG: hypothetical protein HQL16_03790 [Candidatus Omnitrophica bacterium]|nr:hypothetical protein [Candidatus Omnitrophota bacterium]
MFVSLRMDDPVQSIGHSFKFDAVGKDVAVFILDPRGLPLGLDAKEVLKLYREYGLKALPLICRNYAVALCDFRKKRFVLAVDQIGHATFYYKVIGDKFFAALDLKALCQEYLPEVSREALKMYFSCGFIPGRKTIFEGIQKIAPGEYLSIENGRMIVAQYVVPDIRPVRSGKKESGENLRRGLMRSMEATQGVPVGVMFSGGFDSSLLCHLAQQYNRKLKAYTVSVQGYNQETIFQARQAAGFLGVRHEVVEIKMKQYVSAFSSVFEKLNEPAFLPYLAVAHAAFSGIPQGVKFLFSGMGSDELLGNRFSKSRGFLKNIMSFKEYHSLRNLNNGERVAWSLYARVAASLRSYHRLSQGAGRHIVFPFLDSGVMEVVQKIPGSCRQDKKLLRSLAPDLDAFFLLSPRRDAEQLSPVLTGAIAGFYREKIRENRALASLFGEKRMKELSRAGAREDILKCAVFDLWSRKNFPGLA